MAPLQAAAGAGLAVIITRHERKSGGDVGDSGRGSSAYSGAVDTIVSIRRPQGDAQTGTNVRVLQSLSRFDEVPETLVIELTAGGYVVLGDSAAYAHDQAIEKLRAALPATEDQAKTGDKLAEATGVTRALTYSVLKELIAGGEAERRGKGKRSDPYLFWRKQAPAAGPIHSSTTEIDDVDESIPPGGWDSSTTPVDVDESERRQDGEGRAPDPSYSSTTAISGIDEQICEGCGGTIAAGTQCPICTVWAGVTA
jgi:hypothetical protein